MWYLWEICVFATYSVISISGGKYTLKAATAIKTTDLDRFSVISPFECLSTYKIILYGV